MILTVTLNLAIDVTYRVPEVRVGETARVTEVRRRAGGKGVNVARVLHALGAPVVVTGLLGGVTGDIIRAELASAGLVDRAMVIGSNSRTTLIVLDEAGTATGFSEPGPHITPDEWQRWLAEYGRLVESADAVVLSGSVPPGIPDHGYAELIAIAQRRGRDQDRDRPVLLDASGEHLRAAVAAGPSIVKVNAAELAGIGRAGDPLRAAEELRAQGSEAVVITLGPDGLVAATPDGTWRCPAPTGIWGNPTGAGDAAAAAIIAGSLADAPWPDRLIDAVALSAAAVAAPQAGSFDAGLYERLRAEVTAKPA
jgi:tagatose 6-phosphate kinase